MKNGPHNSMIPNQNFSRGNNIQTNFKTNPLKNRNTMAPFSTLNPSTTFTNRTYDTNKGNIEENAEKLFQYLASNDFPIGLSKKILQSPKTKKEYFEIFTFILKKIRPDILPNFNANEETVNLILNELKFPIKFEKKHFSSISQTYSWPKFLYSLTYMCELGDYWDYINKKSEENNIYNMFSSNEEKNEEMKEEDLFNSYLVKAFKSQNIEEEKEKCFNDIISKTQSNISQLEININEYQIINEKILQIKKDFPNLEELENSKINLENSLYKDKEILLSNDNKILSLKKENENKLNENKEKEKEIENLNKKIKNIENMIKKQKFQVEDVNKMNERKNILEAQYENLNKQKKELNEKVNQLKNKINEQKTKIIKSQINTKENYGIENINLDNLILNCENQNYNINDLKNFFMNEINNNKTLQNMKKLELNEKQNELLKIENNGRLIEENLSNKKLELTSIINNLNTKKEEIESEKIKGNNFIQQYQNEYNNTNKLLTDLMTKCSNIEIDISNLENNKKERNLVYEKLFEEADVKNKENSKKIEDTISFIQKTKEEILLEIRQNYKSFNEIFLKMKE